jgi:class 3 adenylate cyclase
MWELRAARGIQDIRADLTGIDLEGISVAGLAGAEFLLPKPRGTVAVKVGGGATGVEISRPRGVAARVEVGGGVHGLTLDGNTFGAVGGRTEWATPDHDHARDRYVISFLRGASSVVVRQRERQEDTGAASIRRLATVLFTDIVGSTRLAADQGDRRWTQMLEQHDEVAARIVREHGGRVVKQTGDGMLALFDRPGSALASATVFRDESRRDGIEIRAGVHTGEVELRGEDVSGIAVHIAARIMDEAPDGEILASRTVRELVAGEDFGFEDRGVHVLRGIDDEWALAAVSRRGD